MTKAAIGGPRNLAGRNASEARVGLESEVADADPPEIRGRPCGMGKQASIAPVPVRRGGWARHARTVIRVIGGSPMRSRVAASTSRQAADRSGVGQGHRTDEAG